MRPRGRRVFAAAAALAAILALVGWFDYRASTGELRSALEAEAASLHATIAAAARVQHAAAGEAERALGQRLLEHARLLAAMDRRGALDQSAVDAIAAGSDLFRIVVFDADGRRAYLAGERPPGAGPGATGGPDAGGGPGAASAGGAPGGGFGPGRGRGQGPGEGRGPLAAGEGHGPLGGEGRGPWAGPPAGASRVAQRLLAGEAEEIVSPPHVSREGAERLAAGVRRAGGGAIVLNAANRLARELDAVYSLDVLASQIAGATPAIGYVVLQDSGGRVARGPLAEQEARSGARLEGDRDRGEREIQTAEGPVPVLERRGTISLDKERSAELRIGMRLDEVRRAERRALIRIAGGLSAIGALLVLGAAFGSLQHRYGALTVRHASAQEALRRRDRLAAMGEMASTVAHEIRNPLNAIAMSAQRLGREYGSALASAGAGSDAAELVGVIQAEASRINGTVQQFLEFARPRPLNAREIGLDRLLREVADAAAALAGARGVRIETEAAGAPKLTADPDQLRQALDNLVRNAIEASSPGGVVTLGAARHGSGAVIEVRDTGAGIAPDALPRIFDLYFTTKREGTGVGLAVVQQIVAAHGGAIDVESAPGSGTRMIIRLPLQGAGRG
ncbi:MAG TPA: ATP-binding protein [Vicinamibacterales bacterium]|nr:ATP-binding protein [Vicinamibacterales bacterium]